jgi:hypothetical protein
MKRFDQAATAYEEAAGRGRGLPKAQYPERRPRLSVGGEAGDATGCCW